MYTMYWYYCLWSINVLLAVIMNEHLMEALRQLRRNSMLTDVWSLMFASRSSQHHERFEMLSLLASVLSWNDLEREKAGLQHVNSSDTFTASSFWSRSSNVGSSAKAELDKSDETEVSLLIHITLYTFEYCTISFNSSGTVTRDAPDENMISSSYSTERDLIKFSSSIWIFF